MFERLQQIITEIDPWTDEGYVLAFADLREVLEWAHDELRKTDESRRRSAGTRQQFTPHDIVVNMKEEREHG